MTPIGAELKRPSLGPKQGRRTPFGKKQKLTSIAPIRAIHRNHISQPQFHRRIMKLEEALMISKYLASALVIIALGANMAAAQTATTRTDAAAASATHREGEWRASKLVGVSVYNEANEKIGDISEIILDNSGKVANVILGVGGFLGMGEHYVAVAYDKLKWVNEPVRSASTASDRPATAPATTVDSNARTASDGTARTTTGTASSSVHTTNWYPDHVVYNATKDQLKAMPEFKY
jgi:sporulation protein YlmC with PRC-barrel domain